MTLRGNHRPRIFFSDADRLLLASIVSEVSARCDARIHAYCGMTNHIHMLVQVSAVPLGRLMLRIASCDARSVQQRLATTGHFFERRFHAILVDADSYLLELVRYIHRHPVRTGSVSDPIDYPWSGHHAYLDPSQATWLTTALALSLLHPHAGLARDAYRRFVVGGETVRWGTGILTPHPDDDRILGDDQFATRARAWIGHRAVAGRIASVSAVARRLGRNESAVRQAMARYPAPSTGA